MMRRMAPAIQDLWMLLTGDDRVQQQLQLAEVIAGYSEFADFDPRELHLVEALRTLRMMHYSAWLCPALGRPGFSAQTSPWFKHRTLLG